MAAATEVWTALREYERALAVVLDPIQNVRIPPDTKFDANNPDQIVSQMDKLSTEHRRAQRADLRRLFTTLTKARDKAEVILPPDTFRPFDECFRGYYRAREAAETMELPFASEDSTREWKDKRDKYLREAGEARHAALAAFHALIGPEERAEPDAALRAGSRR